MMQLTAADYQELQAHGPTGLTADQYFRLVKAVERIKGAAFQEGRLTEREWQRARKELTDAKADIAHAPADALGSGMMSAPDEREVLLDLLTHLPAGVTEEGQEIPLLHMLPESAREYLRDALLTAGFHLAPAVKPKEDER